MFIVNIEYFLSDIRGPRYLHLKKVYFFVGHPVCCRKYSQQYMYIVKSRDGKRFQYCVIHLWLQSSLGCDNYPESSILSQLYGVMHLSSAFLHPICSFSFHLLIFHLMFTLQGILYQQWHVIYRISNNTQGYRNRYHTVETLTRGWSSELRLLFFSNSKIAEHFKWPSAPAGMLSIKLVRNHKTTVGNEGS